MEWRRWILVLVFAAAQLAAGRYASGLVLCLGEDGHVAIEAAHGTCSEAPVFPAGSTVSSRDCHDLPLQLGGLPVIGAGPERAQQTFATTPLPLFTRIGAMSFGESHALHHLDSSSARPDARLTPLRCVILTI